MWAKTVDIRAAAQQNSGGAMIMVLGVDLRQA